MVHLGLQLNPQYTSWDELRDNALLIDELGYDSLMTWDHFVPLMGDATGPNFEGWQILAAWGAITKRVKISMLVTGNTYRHPAVLANMAATLDHITNGRAILGLGAAWHEAEHAMYGIPFDTVPIRLAKMREAARIVRSLLDNEHTTIAGKHYQITDAICEPKPIQKRLPLLIGGGGEQVTLKVVARHADYWHGFGPPETIKHKLEVLKRHCDEVGRDFSEIMPLAGGPCLVRDSSDAVETRLKEVATNNRVTRDVQATLAGTPDFIAEKMAAWWKVGVRGFIFNMHAPHDRETIERIISEVKPRFLELIN